MINQYWPRNRRGKGKTGAAWWCEGIIARASKAIDATVPDIMGQSRKVDHVVKRWIVWHCCLEHTRITANELGNMFGRTRGAVEYGMRALVDELEQNPRARAWMEKARKAL